MICGALCVSAGVPGLTPPSLAGLAENAIDSAFRSRAAQMARTMQSV